MTAFEELLYYPIFQMDKLNSDKVCDSQKFLYYPMVSFQASDTGEARHNFLLIWRRALVFLALYQHLVPAEL